MTAFTHLLAKSTEKPDKPPEAATLKGHISQVISAAEIIDHCLESSLKKMLPAEVSMEMWHEALFCAAWLHDIGKANDHFQTMLRNSKIRQGVRHEAISLITIETVLKDWLEDFWDRYPVWFKAAILFSISGHHLKFPDNRKRNNIFKSDVIFLGKHPQMKDIMEIGKERLRLPFIPELRDQRYSLVIFDNMEVKELIRKIRRHYDLQFSAEVKLFIAMLKNSLMCADLAGSALPVRHINIEQWLPDLLQSVFKPDDLKQIITQRLGQGRLKKFQRQVAETGKSTVLVEAGCGAGKTLAAYGWAAAKATNRKLFFCYPTTATASEGFSNYLYDPGFEALLVHSRVKIDYHLLKNIPHKSPAQREIQYLGLEAIDTWPATAVVCTAHTVLGMLQNTRRGIYAWPSLARAVFVFDEVHAFSDLLFSHLLRFLLIYKHAPVLLMTATLPEYRKKALLQICEQREGMEIISGPEEREQAKRYILSRSKEEEAWELCRKVISSGGKVLWICNTVGRAMKIARLADSSGLPVQPYHSRYRYRDRLERQRTVIDGFLPHKPAMLAVTTQVAEMSLDMSADLLITEYAPVPNLIQRLGRLNRFEDQPDTLSKALFMRPENALPYARTGEEEQFWNGIETWLDQVADLQPKSQQDLSYAFIAGATVECRDWDIPYCDWIDDPWSSQTSKHAIMEPAYTVEIVREEDIHHRPMAEMVIPMPFPRDKNWAWQNQGRYLIAPAGAIHYDPFWGGEYAEELDFEII